MELVSVLNTLLSLRGDKEASLYRDKGRECSDVGDLGSQVAVATERQPRRHDCSVADFEGRRVQSSYQCFATGSLGKA